MKKFNRVIIIGLDGVPHKLIERYTKSGLMPNLEKLCSSGSFHQMNTVLPEVSSVAWSSFMTGKNPAKTGIFGFFDLVPSTYKMLFSNFQHLKEPTLWSIINRELKKPSIIINMPSTYPVKPMNGAIISGFVSPDLNRSVYPSTILSYIQDMNYKIDIEPQKLYENKESILNELFDILDKRIKITNYLWDKADWKLFASIITGTDRLLHFMMDVFDNKNSPYLSTFEKYFSEIDDFIGLISNRLASDDLLIVLSDHGFESIHYSVYLNNYFIQQNILEERVKSAGCFENLTEKTIAFILDPGRVYIHRQNRYPSGKKLCEESYLDILNNIKNSLYALKSPDGRTVIKNIFHKSDIYTGKYFDYAPDLILIPEEGFALKGSLNTNNIFELPTRHTGFHNCHDAFMSCNIPLDISLKPSIIDVSATILEALCIAPEAYQFDGQSLLIKKNNGVLE
jgi:predicted AlkP superfamily phosphohydrolase/phosphomutase